MTAAPDLDTQRRAVISDLATSLKRALAGVLITHIPAGSYVSDETRSVATTVAVGIMACTLRQLIDSAPDHADKGGRAQLMTLARDMFDGKETGP